MLLQRVGHEARMHRENAPETSAGLTACIDGGAGYLADADRFHTDTVGEEYQRRQEEIRKKERAIAFRRNQVEDESMTCIMWCSCCGRHILVSSYNIHSSTYAC